MLFLNRMRQNISCVRIPIFPGGALSAELSAASILRISFSTVIAFFAAAARAATSCDGMSVDAIAPSTPQQCANSANHGEANAGTLENPEQVRQERRLQSAFPC